MGTSWARALETPVAVLLVVRPPISHPHSPLRQISFLFFHALCGLLIALNCHSRDHWTPGLKTIAGLGGAWEVRLLPSPADEPEHSETSWNKSVADLWSSYLSLCTCSNRWTELCWIMLLDHLSMCYMSVLMWHPIVSMCFVEVLLQDFNSHDLVLICSQQQLLSCDCSAAVLFFFWDNWFLVEIRSLHHLCLVLSARCTTVAAARQAGSVAAGIVDLWVPMVRCSYADRLVRSCCTLRFSHVNVRLPLWSWTEATVCVRGCRPVSVIAARTCTALCFPHEALVALSCCPAVVSQESPRSVLFVTNMCPLHETTSRGSAK